MNWQQHARDAIAAASVGMGCALVMFAASCVVGEVWIYFTQ